MDTPILLLAGPSQTDGASTTFNKTRQIEAIAFKIGLIAGTTMDIAIQSGVFVLKTAASSSRIAEHDTILGSIASELHAVAQSSVSAAHETSGEIKKLFLASARDELIDTGVSLDFGSIRGKVAELYRRASEIVAAVTDLDSPFAATSSSIREIRVLALALRKACKELYLMAHQLSGLKETSSV